MNYRPSTVGLWINQIGGIMKDLEDVIDCSVGFRTLGEICLSRGGEMQVMKCFESSCET